MNKFAFILLLFLTSSYSQEKQVPVKLKGIVLQNDYHNNISWIKSKPTPLVSKDFTVSALQVKYIQIYFGLEVVNKEQQITPIRLVNNYKDKDWIFFDEVSYLLGTRKEVRAGKGIIFKIKDDDTNRDVHNGVSEYSDVLATGDAKAFIKYIVNNAETNLSIRYTDTSKNVYREIRVPNGTKKLKKHFEALIKAYNDINESYALEKPF